ncbi:ATP-binding cassette domain-containing protein [Dongia deserti]|uniref:ATP-binding cassette domain-containing protein n=1 Tax=Dongia deserti TaxID=2268030 RepID=UPI000E64B62E|nr:ATP-binding cassette domain-containing protein [Dongia deserti]
MLELRDAAISHQGQRLFAPVSCRIQPGRPVTIMGPSGAGKSSLLAWLTGVLPPGLLGEGDVLLDGHSILALPAHRRRLGILFQDDLLFPHMSVGENLAFGLPAGADRATRQRKVEEALARVELAGFAHRDPLTLSGGERARVALLRVLLSEPKALLLDEPFSKLDLTLRDRFRSLVFQSATHLPVLLVSHDPQDSIAAGGEVVQLRAIHQPGRIS